LSDEQVISLLVVLPPRLEVSFYRPPDPFFVGQPGSLPLQVVNLDRNSVILGRLTVIADGAQVENASVLVGALDPGGFFSHDALLIPPVPGPLQVQARLDYVDDFNQAQSILVELPLEVLDAPPFDPGSEEPIPIDPASEPESGLQKVWRLVLGLLGLDSGRDEGGGFVTPDGEFPPDEGFPIDGPSPLGPGPKGG
jgi:hypothetical protein